jgi:predicted DNA-binding transcriptional regulator AlpA
MSDVDVLDEQTRVTQPDAARLLGNVSQMTLWRWRRNKELKFPKSVEINGRHYYVRAEILAWRPPTKPPEVKFRRKAPVRKKASARGNG